MAYEFSEFLLDTEQRQLQRSGAAIHLTPKAYQLLLILLERRPRVLSKAEIQELLWPDTFVTESNLGSLVAELRRQLEDDARRARFIRTVHGFGYGFVGDAIERQLPPPPHTESDFGLFAGEGREYRLHAGSNVVGRDPAADVHLDDHTVSRRHARLLVTENGVALEDLSSKNGTMVNGVRVDSNPKLVDGDALTFGGVTFVLRKSPTSTTTLRFATVDRRDLLEETARAAELELRER